MITATEILMRQRPPLNISAGNCSPRGPNPQQVSLFIYFLGFG